VKKSRRMLGYLGATAIAFVMCVGPGNYLISGLTVPAHAATAITAAAPAATLNSTAYLPVL